MNKFGFAIILLGLVMFAGVSVEAAVYTVDNNNDFTAGQNCTAAPNDCTLRAAITFANNSPDNDTINFDPAVFATQQEIPLGSFQQFTIANNGTLTINGPGAKLLSLNGFNFVRVLNVTGGSTVSISGLTIRNGSASENGAGIYNLGNLTLNDCEIKFNNALPGTFPGGGGIYNEGSLNLINSTVYGNNSNYGGGITNSNGGILNVINSTISGNKASDGGGGIWNEGSNTPIHTATTNLINSTVAFNSCEVVSSNGDCRGGGLNRNGGTINSRNSIIAGNFLTVTGDGRAFLPDIYNRLTSQDYNLIGLSNSFNTFIEGDTTGNILDVNSQLGSLADNGGQTLTHALLSGSPAINAGSNSRAVDQNNNPLTTDQRGTGFPRINNATVDMGAYETLLLPANTTTTITADTPDPSTQGQSVNVSYNVAAAVGTPTGNVTVSDGVNTCIGTVAAGQCSLTLNTIGNRTLTASYSGDANYNPSVSAGVSHQVNGNAPLDLVVDTTSDNGALTACTAAANNCSLRGAISRANAANTNDTISFDPTVFAAPQTITLSNGELAVTNNGGLTINGTGANRLTVSGNNASRVFNFNTTSPIVINGLTITGGNANASGGGGVLSTSTFVTLNYCNISVNTTTGNGGGLYNVGGFMSINSSTVAGNISTGVGGGIANGGNPSELYINNSTVSGNTSNGIGGGGIFLSGLMSVRNSTITNNTANGDGTNTGLGGEISNFTLETVSLGNTIVAGNNAPTAPDFRDTLNSLGYNLIGNTNGTIITGNTTGNLLNVNAQLGTLASNGGTTLTHALLQGSPAINGGNNGLTSDQDNRQFIYDQRGIGFDRINTGTVDIGAFEYSLPVITENPQSQTKVVGSPVTFTSRAGVFSQTGATLLASGQSLLPGQFLISPNYGYQFFYQPDGNLVLYRGDGVVLWASNTGGTSPGQAVMQGDGNFVIYDGNGSVQFSTGTFGNLGATLAVQSDGNIVIYSQGGTPLFSTGTAFTGPNNPVPTVQWQVSTDGGRSFADIVVENFSDINGANTPNFSFTVQLADNGKQFRAVFTNFAGTVASSPATLTVNKADTTTRITGESADPTLPLQAFTVSYNVVVIAPGTGTPTGNVTVSDGVDSCVGTVAAGICSLTLTTTGDRTLTATYSGDTNFNGSISAGEPHSVSVAHPLNLIVDNISDDGNLSLCTAAPNDCSLRGAVTAANNAATDDTITFDSTVFASAQTITLGGTQLSIANSGALTIQGSGANLLSISGNNSSRILEILSPVSVNISGLTLTQGNGTGGTSSFGGAIRVFSGGASLNLDAVSVIGNNSSGGGGGIQLSFASSVNITNSTFNGNTAAFGGGAMQIETPNVVNITNTTISGNFANLSTSGGGGIRITGSSPGVINITNSTITNNSTAFDGGGFRQEDPHTINLRNTIVAGNIDSSGNNSPDISGTITSGGYNLIGNNSGGTITAASGDQIGTGTTPLNAQLLPLADNGGTTQTHKLLSNSPAINRGSNALAVDVNNNPLTTDQRGAGFKRITSGTVDVGAYESSLPVVLENPRNQTAVVGSPVVFTSRAGIFSQTRPSSLASGTSLLPGEFLISPNYGYQFFYQNDGNLVLYRGDGVVLWSSNTSGTTPGHAEMQTDGNFVIYNSVGTAQFSTGTSGNPGATLAVQSDGNVVIYDQIGTAIYSTGTANLGNDPIPTIQWQVSTDNGANFNDIGGANTPNLSFIAQITDNGKQYRAVFTNFEGAAASAAATLTVNKADTTTTITGDSPDPTQQGESFTVSYSIAVIAPGAGTPTGNVTVSDGINSCVGTVADGQCSLTLFTTGNRTLTATYDGDESFNASVSAGEPHTVSTVPPLTLVVDNISDDGNLSACTAAIDDCSLRGAINRANTSSGDDVINFDPGTFALARTITLAQGELAIVNNGSLTINGSGANLLTINGNNASCVFEINTSANLTLNDATVTGGNSNFGGGINNQGTLSLNNSAITGNTGNDAGAGILSDNNSSTTITNSTVSNNNAPNNGGGIYFYFAANASITNSTVSDNTAGGIGGGITTESSPLQLNNTTVSDNSGSNGGGIGNINGGVVNSRNSLIAGNTAPTAPDFSGTLTSQGYNLIGNTTGTTIVGDTTGNILNQDSLLAPLGFYGGTTMTHKLLSGSPAIDKGGSGSDSDQRGASRPYDNPAIANASGGNGSDIGAVEIQLPPDGQGIEGDITGRFTGDGLTNTNDLILLRQMVSRNIIPTDLYNEFQRADTAPSTTFGDGLLNSNDLIVLRRYAAHLDPNQTAAGPSDFSTPPSAASISGLLGKSVGELNTTLLVNTVVRVSPQSTSAGQTVTVPILVDASNNEAGFDLSLMYDRTKLIYQSAALGNNVPSNTNLTINPNETSQGHIGFLIDSGNTFSGTIELLMITFTVATVAPAGDTPISFINSPLPLNTSDNMGNSVATTYTPGNVTISGPTAANVSISGRVLSPTGRGVPIAAVHITDQSGNMRTARTNPFGFYRFENIEVGQSLIINVFSKQYQFTIPSPKRYLKT